MIGWDGGWGVGGWLAMTFMMLLVWGVPIALVVWLVVFTSRRGGERHPTVTPSAEQILAERYARGEIDEEELARRREALLGTSERSP